MAQITVIRDPNIELSEIVTALRTPSDEELPDNDSTLETQQTKVMGILMPILVMNDIAVDFGDVVEFSLDCTGNFPEVKFAFRDRNNMLKNLNNPGNDNELRVQILPPFDNAYKKIDLAFMCHDLSINDGVVSGKGIYKLLELTKSRFAALGPVSTYELFDKVSTDTGLGFAANLETTEDVRYIQCRFESYKDVLRNEIRKSFADETHVYDWWVDVWNNLILCDMFDRINSEDPEEDMLIWSAQNSESSSKTDEVIPVETLALFTNHPFRDGSDLSVIDYEVENNPVHPERGNLLAFSVFEENKKEWIDHYVADGDIQKNEFIKFEYMGEVYGDYNYLVAERARKLFIDKLNSEVIVIHTGKPQLGIMRGDQLRFVWYDASSGDAAQHDMLVEAGAAADNEQLSAILGWVKDFDLNDEHNDNPMRVNVQFSGQYTCIGQYISYSQDTQTWDCWLYLSRPADKRPKIFNVGDE